MAKADTAVEKKTGKKVSPRSKTLQDANKPLSSAPKKLLKLHKQSPKKSSIPSEGIVIVLEVTKIGIDVFGNFDKFALWLNTPNFALGNVKPITLLVDAPGKEMVISELTRINYGILA